MSALKKTGLDPETVRKQFPNLIYCLSTPRGTTGEEENRSDYLIWWAEADLGQFVEPIPPSFCPQMGELHTEYIYLRG
eukprot:UN31237